MSSTLARLTDLGLATPPTWLASTIQMEVINGSYTYGVSTDESDFDIYGFCVPHKDVIFPHLRGVIPGFGKKDKVFWQYQQHHIHDPSARAGKGQDYDITIYNIVKYFQLCMEGNPNMVNTLFCPRECVLYSTRLAEFLRENRRLFLHKGCWHKYKGYAYSQMHKMKTSKPQEGSKRDIIVKRDGFDTKFGYHVVRLLGEVEQILAEGDLDLRRNKEQLKAIRRGEWTLDELIKWAADKELALEKVYEESELPWGPPEAEIKEVMLECLRMVFGSLEATHVEPGEADRIINEVATLANSYRHRSGAES